MHFHLVSHILLAFPESIRDISANIPLAKNHGSAYLRMFFTRLLPLILFVLPATGIDAFGQSLPDSGRVLTAIRTSEPIKIDGKLTEQVWQRRGESQLIQRQPDEGAPASEKTEVWIAYDENALYVGVKLYDNHPDSIVGRLARRDEAAESDDLTIGIDAAHDRRSGLYFAVNSAGAIGDGTLSNDVDTDGSWDGIWQVGVSTERWGWCAEFRIPFSQLRFAERDRYTWGFEVQRRIQRKNEESFLSFYPRTDRVRVSRFPALIGIEGIKPPARIELLPYAAATGKFIQGPAVASFNRGRTDPFETRRNFPANVGLDAKVGLSGDITLDLSLNPDFAQVEVDPAIVNLTAYETYFQEKRPFFIEGANILRFGRGGASTLQDFDWSDPSFFYSRRIGRAPQGSVTHDGFLNVPDRTTILGATKISGKFSDSWSFAALSALTDREYGEVDSAGVRFKDEIEPLSFYSVVRTLKEFNGSRQAIGILGTAVERNIRDSRIAGLLNNRASSIGIDGWSFLDQPKVWVLTGWAGASRVSGSADRITSLQRSSAHYFQRPDASYLKVDTASTSMTGWASRIWLDKVSGNWIFNAALGAINPSFETNDIGFLNRADYINGHVYFGYEWFEPEGWFRTKALTGAIVRAYDFGGNLVGETYEIFLSTQFMNYWSATLAIAHNGETFDNQRTRGGPLMKSLSSQSGYVSVGSDARENLYGSLNASAGKGKSGGWLATSGLYLNWKASRTVNASISLDFSRVHSASQYITEVSDPFAAATYGARYVFGELDQKQISTSFRLNWTFTPTLSFQLYVQPLISTGAYSSLMELARPGTFTFNKYGERGSSMTLSDGTYYIDPDGEGKALQFPIWNPDFNFKSIRANAVFRWEYLPGSTLYFVWTNEKMNYESRGDFSLGRDFDNLLRTTPDNVYSIKLTYWFNP